MLELLGETAKKKKKSQKKMGRRKEETIFHFILVTSKFYAKLHVANF